MKKHYFLIATQVLYKRDGLERQRNYNVLISNDSDTITRRMIGYVQQQAQVRFFNEFDLERKSEIIDVFILATNRLGEMTDAEFHAGFVVPEDEDLSAPADSGGAATEPVNAPTEGEVAPAAEPAPVASTEATE